MQAFRFERQEMPATASAAVHLQFKKRGTSLCVIKEWDRRKRNLVLPARVTGRVITLSLGWTIVKEEKGASIIYTHI